MLVGAQIPALGDAGLPAEQPALARAADWLLSKEVDRFGDWWEVPRRGRPGGWSFEFDNVWYPDTDDTAEVMLALLRAGLPREHPAIRRGADWLLAILPTPIHEYSPSGWRPCCCAQYGDSARLGCCPQNRPALFCP